MAGRLVIFTRYPEPGRVKTRLIPVLGPEGAAELHRRMISQTLNWARTLAASGSMDVEIHIDSCDLKRARLCFGDDFKYVRQVGGDLGERLIAALGLVEQPTIVIGTDCPALDLQRIWTAREALETSDVVIGPATDGGYYLIGMKRQLSELFIGIEWGTDRVFAATRNIVARLGLTDIVLEELADVDRPEDLSSAMRVLTD